MYPQLQVGHCMYKVPILHLLIVLINKVWTSLFNFLDKFVENITFEEAYLKEKSEYHSILIKNINCEIDIHTVNEKFTNTEIEFKVKNHLKFINYCVRH